MLLNIIEMKKNATYVIPTRLPKDKKLLCQHLASMKTFDVIYVLEREMI